MATIRDDGKRVRLIYNYREEGANNQFAPKIADSGIAIGKKVEASFNSKYPDLKGLLNWRKLKISLKTRPSLNVIKNGEEKQFHEAVIKIKKEKKLKNERKLERWTYERYSDVEFHLSKAVEHLYEASSYLSAVATETRDNTSQRKVTYDKWSKSYVRQKYYMSLPNPTHIDGRGWIRRYLKDIKKYLRKFEN